MKNTNKKYVLGFSTLTGKNALLAEEAGCDFILALNAGKYRSMGWSSHAAYLANANSNNLVMEVTRKELAPLKLKIPIYLGVNGTDPFLDYEEVFSFSNKYQITGIVNYPTLALIDGNFRQALYEDGIKFEQEVELLKKAKEAGFKTIGFVSSLEETRLIAKAKVDYMCIHLSLTGGGTLGAQHVYSIREVMDKIEFIIEEIESISDFNSSLLIYGGPIIDVEELRYVYNNIPELDGYIGGSTFERVVSEIAVSNQLRTFKNSKKPKESNLTVQILEGIDKYYDYADFIKKYIEENYPYQIRLSEIADLINLDANYLSDYFKKKTGTTFSHYLIKYRLNKAVELMETTNMNLNEIASSVGYQDYAQFNKVFRKYMGVSPSKYRKLKEI